MFDCGWGFGHPLGLVISGATGSIIGTGMIELGGRKRMRENQLIIKISSNKLQKAEEDNVEWNLDIMESKWNGMKMKAMMWLKVN